MSDQSTSHAGGDLVLSLVDGGLEGGNDTFRILRPKDGRSGHNDIAPLGKKVGVSDFTRPGFSYSSTYQRQRIHRSSWVQHRRRLQYLYLGIAHATRTPWAHICPGISGRPCLGGLHQVTKCVSCHEPTDLDIRSSREAYRPNFQSRR
jgi:hypothetical protein